MLEEKKQISMRGGKDGGGTGRVNYMSRKKQMDARGAYGCRSRLDPCNEQLVFGSSVVLLLGDGGTACPPALLAGYPLGRKREGLMRMAWDLGLGTRASKRMI